MPVGSGTSMPLLARGGPRGEIEFIQNRPAQHAEYQYEGMLKGLGTTSRDPTCQKKNSETKRIHDATHFAIGCKKWEAECNRGPGTTHTTFTDPQVVYATCDAPDKNVSVVELRNQPYNPDTHYRTEQRSRFEDVGPQPRDAGKAPLSKLHLGDDRPGYALQSHSCHRRVPEDEDEYHRRLRAAGAGMLIPTSMWQKPVRCNPVHGGPRRPDIYDLGVANDIRHDRVTQNSSNIVKVAAVRNPIFGTHTALEDYGAPKVPNPARSTHKLLADVNAEVPPLRSLGALRPH